MEDFLSNPLSYLTRIGKGQKMIAIRNKSQHVHLVVFLEIHLTSYVTNYPDGHQPTVIHNAFRSFEKFR